MPALLLAALAAAVLPFAFATIPPLNDYPFRLASVRILQQIDSPGFFAEFYERRSWLVPNVATDLSLLALARLLPLESAGRVFVVAVQTLTLSGCVFLHRAATRRRDPWPIVSALFLHNWILLFGFLNFQLGVALMLWAVGAWLLVRERSVPTRLAVGTTAALVLFFCHMLAFGFYAIVVAAIELGAAFERRHAPATALTHLGVGALPFVPGLVLFARSSTFAAGSSGGVEFQPHWWWKPFALARHFMSGNLYVDALTAAGGLVLVGVLVSGAKVSLTRRLAPAVAALVLSFLAMPFGFYTAVHLDVRVPMLLWFVGIAALRVDFSSRRAARAFAVAAALLLSTRSAVIAYDWRHFNHVYDEVLTAFAAVPAGSTLVVATGARPAGTVSEWIGHWQPQLTHVHALASVRRPIFSAAQWAHPAQQPFTVRDRYAPIYAFQNNNPAPVANVTQLRHFGERAAAHWARTRAPGGPSRELFLLLLYPAGIADTPPGWRRAGSGDRFTLFAVGAS